MTVPFLCLYSPARPKVLNPELAISLAANSRKNFRDRYYGQAMVFRREGTVTFREVHIVGGQ